MSTPPQRVAAGAAVPAGQGLPLPGVHPGVPPAARACVAACQPQPRIRGAQIHSTGPVFSGRDPVPHCSCLGPADKGVGPTTWFSSGCPSVDGCWEPASSRKRDRHQAAIYQGLLASASMRDLQDGSERGQRREARQERPRRLHRSTSVPLRSDSANDDQGEGSPRPFRRRRSRWVPVALG